MRARSRSGRAPRLERRTPSQGRPRFSSRRRFLGPTHVGSREPRVARAPPLLTGQEVGRIRGFWLRWLLSNGLGGVDGICKLHKADQVIRMPRCLEHVRQSTG